MYQKATNIGDILVYVCVVLIHFEIENKIYRADKKFSSYYYCYEYNRLFLVAHFQIIIYDEWLQVNELKLQLNSHVKSISIHKKFMSILVY